MTPGHGPSTSLGGHAWWTRPDGHHPAVVSLETGDTAAGPRSGTAAEKPRFDPGQASGQHRDNTAKALAKSWWEARRRGLVRGYELCLTVPGAKATSARLSGLVHSCSPKVA